MKIVISIDDNGKVLIEDGSFVNLRPNKGKSILADIPDMTVIDIETTGLDSYCCSIIELAAVKIRNHQIIDKFQTLIDPEEEIDSFIIELTGITNEMVKGKPLFKDVIEEYLTFIGQDIVMGHNVNFDVNFLYDKCIDLNLDFQNDFLDTMRLSRRLFKKLSNHKLITLVKAFGIEEKTSHRAMDDAEQTFHCYEYMIKYAFTNGINISELNLSRNKTLAKHIIATSDEFDIAHPLFKKTCVFTGTLERMTRKEAMQLVANIGGLVADNVTKETNYLILGNNDYRASLKEGKSNKQKRAEKMELDGFDIDIIPEQAFYELIFCND